MVSQKEFLERFTGALEQDVTSPTTGRPLPWAPGHPRDWASAKAAIRLGQETKSTPALSADDALLAVGVGADVHVYDVATQERLATLPGDDGGGAVVEAVHLARETDDGDRLLVAHSGVLLGDTSARVVLWRLRRRRDALLSEPLAALDGQLGLWGSTVFGHDGQTLVVLRHNASTQLDAQDAVAVAARDAASLPCIDLWDTRRQATRHRLRGHTDAVQCVVLAPRGTVVASAAWDGTARIWDAATGACVRVLGPFGGGQLWCAALSPDATHVALSQESPRGRVHVCDVATGRTVSTVVFHLWTRSLAWSPAGDALACAADPGTVAVWDPYTAEHKMRWRLRLDDAMGTMARPRAVRFLGNGRKLVFQLNEGTVYAYDLDADRQYRFARGPRDQQDTFPRAEMTCSERIVVVPDTEGVLRLWDF